MNINLERLNNFIVMAHEGSLTAAAKKTGTTQPNLGRQMTALQKDLNLVLFSRHSRGILLTKDGLKFLKASQNLLANLHHEVDAIKETANQASGPFVVMGDTATHDAVINAMVLISERYPLVDCQFINGNNCTGLVSGAVDVVITSASLNSEDFVQHHLFDIGIKLYASQKYLEANKCPQSLEHLKGHKLVAAINNGQDEKNPVNFHINENTDSSIAQVSMEMLYQALVSGMGIGPFFPSQLGERETLIDVFPKSEPHTIPYYATIHKRMERSLKIKAFLQYMNQA